MKTRLTIVFFLALPCLLVAQTGVLKGRVISSGQPLEFAAILLEGTGFGSTTDSAGAYLIADIPPGEYRVSASFLGKETVVKQVVIPNAPSPQNLNFDLPPAPSLLDQVVVTGARTARRQTQSPVIVHLTDQKTLQNIQACNLADGLKFQPGLRVETNCQTCNYTQLRMNGLAGGYSQILINGRPIFSPLTGLYGLEQLPANMIERIETVRGGGSTLYGSGAIGGTVNIITRLPKNNAFEAGYSHYFLTPGAQDRVFSGNASVLTAGEKAGATFFVNVRERDFLDRNGDNFSELPLLRNQSLGANFFILPAANQKLEFSLSSLNEYRFGGEMTSQPAHLAEQAEERTHRVWMGNLDYQINSTDGNRSLIAYLGGQYTGRSHYTGLLPDDSLDQSQHLANPPYGQSQTSTWQGGLQTNIRLPHFPGEEQIVTLGAEYLSDRVVDSIQAYNYAINQRTQNLGIFLQSDWLLLPSLRLLSGIRADRHNLLDRPILSPRISLLYRLKESAQFRLTWSTGFRAPQAFDADLHIAFAGGGVSRISLAPDLREERSGSLSGSVSYDKASDRFIAGFTLEGFYTRLNGAFYQHPLGADAFGERFEKRNGSGATVGGASLEIRANYDGQAQLEGGFTWQISQFDEAITYLEGLEPERLFLRTPNHYGYAMLTLFPEGPFGANINLVYTGPMLLIHLAGAPEQPTDTYQTSPSFWDLGLRLAYTLPRTGLQVFTGVKNLFDSYQTDFDSGKFRDSNYVYGPGIPRGLFVGLTWRSE